MSYAEDLALLTLTDGGHPRGQANELGLGGAMLCELAALERLSVDARGRLVVVDGRSTGDEVLDESLTRWGERVGRKPQYHLQIVSRGLRRRVLSELARQEAVQERRYELPVVGGRVYSGWPVIDTARRDRLVAELGSVLAGRALPDARTGALIGLLSAVSALSAAVPRELWGGRRPGEVRREARKLAQARWAGKAAAWAIASQSGG